MALSLSRRAGSDYSGATCRESQGATRTPQPLPLHFNSASYWLDPTRGQLPWESVKLSLEFRDCNVGWVRMWKEGNRVCKQILPNARLADAVVSWGPEGAFCGRGRRDLAQCSCATVSHGSSVATYTASTWLALNFYFFGAKWFSFSLLTPFSLVHSFLFVAKDSIRSFSTPGTP